jgi:hypothetical protein
MKKWKEEIKAKREGMGVEEADTCGTEVRKRGGGGGGGGNSYAKHWIRK